jgi:hypothetical protein
MSEQLVTVRTYSTTFEANLVRGKLEASDVNAFLSDDNIINVNPLLTNLMGGVKVLVPKDEIDKARRVLALENG